MTTHIHTQEIKHEGDGKFTSFPVYYGKIKLKIQTDTLSVDAMRSEELHWQKTDQSKAKYNALLLTTPMKIK